MATSDETQGTTVEQPSGDLASALNHTASRWGVAPEQLHAAGCRYAINNPAEVIDRPD